MFKYVRFLIIIPTLLVMVLSMVAFGASPAAHAAPPSPQITCGYQPNSYYYLSVVNWGISRADVSPEYYYNNTTSTTVTKTWTATISASITVSASGQVKANLSAIIAGVEAQVNSGVQFSITGTYTDTITYNIPPGKSIGVTYGVSQQIADGEYYYVNSSCNLLDQGPQESWTPWRIEWMKVEGNL